MKHNHTFEIIIRNALISVTIVAWLMLVLSCSERSNDPSGTYCQLQVKNYSGLFLEVHCYPEGEVKANKHVRTMEKGETKSFSLKEYCNYEIFIESKEPRKLKWHGYIQTLGSDYVFVKEVF